MKRYATPWHEHGMEVTSIWFHYGNDARGLDQFARHEVGRSHLSQPPVLPSNSRYSPRPKRGRSTLGGMGEKCVIPSSMVSGSNSRGLQPTKVSNRPTKVSLLRGNELPSSPPMPVSQSAYKPSLKLGVQRFGLLLRTCFGGRWGGSAPLLGCRTTTGLGVQTSPGA